MINYEGRHRREGQHEWHISPDYLNVLTAEAAELPIAVDNQPDWRMYLFSLHYRYMNTASFYKLARKTGWIGWNESSDSRAKEDIMDAFFKGGLLGLRLSEAVLGPDFDLQLSTVNHETCQLFGADDQEKPHKVAPRILEMAGYGWGRITNAEPVLRNLMSIFPPDTALYGDRGFGYMVYNLAALEDAKLDTEIEQMADDILGFEPEKFIQQVFESQRSQS